MLALLGAKRAGFADLHASNDLRRADLVSGPRRLRACTPAHTALVATALTQPLLRRKLQLSVQLWRRLLAVNEVAETAAHTPIAAVQSAACLPEIRNRTQLAVDRSSRIPSAVQALARRLCRILVLEPRVHIADQVVVVVVAHHHLFNLAEFAHLAPEILVEGVEVVLQLRRCHARLAVVGGVLVEVGQKDRLAVGGLDVFARASVAVAAGADFVVEGAVDLVLLGTEDGGEVVSHGAVGAECVVWWFKGVVEMDGMLCDVDAPLRCW